MKFGKIGHVGIVVRDLQAAKEHYSRLFGIDKWYELAYDTPLDMTYRGEKRNCNVTLYFGGKGHTAIELIYPQGDENIYTTFLRNHGEMIHHIEYNVKDLDAAIAHVEEEGLKVLQAASFGECGRKGQIRIRRQKRGRHRHRAYRDGAARRTAQRRYAFRNATRRADGQL